MFLGPGCPVWWCLDKLYLIGEFTGRCRYVFQIGKALSFDTALSWLLSLFILSYFPHLNFLFLTPQLQSRLFSPSTQIPHLQKFPYVYRHLARICSESFSLHVNSLGFQRACLFSPSRSEFITAFLFLLLFSFFSSVSIFVSVLISISWRYD